MRNFVMCAGLLFPLVGCAGPRMAPPADLVKQESLPVEGRSRATGMLVDESFSIGPYQIAEVDRDWNSSSSVGVGPWSKETKTTGYQFELHSGKDKLPGKCESEHKSQGVLALGGEFSWGDVRIVCTCGTSKEGGQILLTDDENSAKVAGSAYEVAAIHEEQGGSTQSAPLGFRLDADEPFAAVEVAHPGSVWLKKGLNEAERQQTACLFAGLMLYQPPSDN